MRRGLLATLVLLSAAGLCRADYVVIVANLNAKDPQPAGGGMRGGPGMIGGGPGMIGGGPGMIGGGGGLQIGGPPAGGMIGGGNLGRPGGAGGPGGPAGGFPGGGMIGGGPGMPRGGPSGGMPGAAGGTGAQGGFGAFGGGFGLGGGNPAGGQPASPDAADELNTLIVVVLEVDGPSSGYIKKFNLGLPILFKHRWGSVHLKKKDAQYEVELIEKDGKPLPTVSARFRVAHDLAFKNKASTDEILKKVANWALEHGLVDEFAKVMDRLAETDKSHPKVAAYLRVKADLARPLSKEDVTEKYKGKIVRDYRATQTDSHHYALLHGQGVSESEVKAHLDRLERSFRSYYYWWATRGISLPVPTQRLVAIWTDKGTDFSDLRKNLTASPLVADSFFARRESLPVFNGGRGDLPYLTFQEVARPLWEKGFDPKAIISNEKGQGYPRPYPKNHPAVEGPRTVALLLKAMEYEWQRTNTSHETSRQLLYASGLLPGNVNVPEWVQFGMGSFFETPLQSPWSGTGAPSPYWLPRFREYEKAKKYESTPRDTLLKIITDQYFRGKEAQTPTPKEKLSQERRARAAAWSLTYYLAQQELGGLQRYFKELSRMPRDVELDDEVLIGAFARAFDCVTASKQVDKAKLGDLANSWTRFMTNQYLEAEAIHKKIRSFYEKMMTEPPAGNRGGPGGPGLPGAGGGRGGRGFPGGR